MKKISDMEYEEIEERARKVMPDMFRVNDNYVTAYVCGYCQGTADQRKIDDDAMYAIVEQEVLKAIEKQKRIDIDKADKWLRTHLPRVISNYPYVGGTTDMLNEDMRAEFRKAMEKQD